MNRPFPVQPTVRLASPVPKGMDFARLAIAKAMAGDAAVQFATTRWGEDSSPFRKSPVGAGSTGGAGGELSGPPSAAIEFMAAAFALTAVGQLALRRRPPRTRYLVNLGTAKGGWVGAGKSIPVLPFSFDDGTLNLKKVAAIIVQTDELLRSTDPAAELDIRNDLLNGLAEAIDTAFFDPGNGGDADTPASITDGLTPLAIGTGDQDDVRDGLSHMIETFEGDLSRAVWVARPEVFAIFSGFGYRDIGLRGGELVGAPAIATQGLPVSSGGRYILLLVDPDGIGFASDPGATQVTSSTNAALQMDSAPTNDSVTPTATNLVTCFQSNSSAMKALAYANWAVERPGAVSMMLAFPQAAAS